MAVTAKDLMGRVVDTLYDGLTGGSSELTLPQNVTLNFLMPGVPFHESAFDFAIAGPYAGPTPLTLDDFRALVETLMGGGGDDDDDDQPAPAMDRAAAVEEAKRMYQQHLLGSYEQWSRLVDFIPLPKQTGNDFSWRPSVDDDSKYKHVSVVFAQSNRRLSDVYADTLRMCEVAKDELTEEQEKILKRMRGLLVEMVEVEDLLTGEVSTEPRESRAMAAYKEKRSAYENAVIDYAQRLARANDGTAQDLVEWQRSGGIYRRRATEALRDWEGTGYKNEIENAQATLSHILGRSMVSWKEGLEDVVDEIKNNIMGAFGYAFFPASVLPGGFARSEGWSQFSEYSYDRATSDRQSSRSWSASAGLNLGLFSIGGGGGGSRTQRDVTFDSKSFRMSFEYTTVEIMRPWFHPNFFLSRSWRPSVEFVREYDTQLHSDGESPASGAMIGYPTKALFVRNLVIHSSEISSVVRERESDIRAGGSVGYGPFTIGGRYQQSNRSRETNYELDGATIRVRGLQLVGFLSALLPRTANPSPDIETWI